MQGSARELHRELVVNVSPFKPAGTWGQVSSSVVIHVEPFETMGLIKLCRHKDRVVGSFKIIE